MTDDGGTKPNPPPETEDREPSAFDRFAEFARRIVSVPKAEVDEQARHYRAKKEARKVKPA